MRRSLITKLALGAVSTALVCYGILNSRRLQVTRETVTIPGLPPAFEGFTLLQLADLHLGTSPHRVRQLLDVIHAERPDLVCLTGDYVLTDPSLPQVHAFLSRVAAGAPAVATYGNADYRPGVTAAERRHWATRVPFLCNSAMPVKREDALLWIAGVDDPHLGRDDLSAAMASVPSDVPVILLAHSPEIIRRPLDPRIRLVLSGHTHGGQVCLPGGRALYHNTSLPARFASGRHMLDGVTLYVSRGVGSTRLPLRLWCLPEITVFTLTGG